MPYLSQGIELLSVVVHIIYKIDTNQTSNHKCRELQEIGVQFPATVAAYLCGSNEKHQKFCPLPEIHQDAQLAKALKT